MRAYVSAVKETARTAMHEHETHAQRQYQARLVARLVDMADGASRALDALTGRRVRLVLGHADDDARVGGDLVDGAR